MLSDDDLAALREARHPDPFAVLGLQPVDKALWARAFLPGARAVTLRDTATGRRVADLLSRLDAQGQATGLFEAVLPRRVKPFDYRLDVTWADGSTGLIGDAYRYGPLIGEQDLHYRGEGSHLRPFEVLGAHPMTLGEGVYAIAGTQFAVWAPNAGRVSVVGSFNGWDGRRHPMRPRGSSGVWELFIPGVQAGDLYKFEICTRDGVLLPLKADPYARASQLRPDTASVVAPPLPPRRPLPDGRAEANRREAPMAIYEVHLGSWRRHPDGSPGGRFYTWDDLAGSLPAYAAGLGFTHIELLPISEHPFDGSWGYQTLGLYSEIGRASCRERVS
jgi:1,4-alpha-glucan branching enzyme